jgi:hypothetical protein
LVELHTSPGKSVAAVEPVHQMAIERTLQGQVDQRSLNILVKQQTIIDERQSAAEQPLHAMTGEGMTEQEAISQANRFVHEEIKLARDDAAAAAQLQPTIDSLKVQIEKLGDSPTSAKDNEFKSKMVARLDALTGKQRGLQDEAMVHLGNAIHTLQDATSPAHEGFQTYHPSPAGAAGHALKEFQYPKNGTREQARLEGATRWGFEMYRTGNVPEKVFGDSGYIKIPPEFIHYSQPTSLIDILRPNLDQYNAASRSLSPAILPEMPADRSISPALGPGITIPF